MKINLQRLMRNFKILLILVIFISCKFNNRQIANVREGDKIDSLNGVYVYYNGSYRNVKGRSIAPDGYNLGLKYQCVEFVKRYYYFYLHHKMPNSYGHAKDFYNKKLSDGQYNKSRALYQYSNPSKSKPQINDLLVFKGNSSNSYGHVAIISKVLKDKVEIIQQNVGQNTRIYIGLDYKNGLWNLDKPSVLGWLRK